MDASRDYHSKKRKSERQVPYHLYEESKIWPKEIYLWNRLIDMGSRFVTAKGEMGRGAKDWEFVTGKCKLRCTEWTNKTLLHMLLLSRFSRVRLSATPETAAHQAPPSLGFSRQEHWSGLPFPSPMHESEKWKSSRSTLSDPMDYSPPGFCENATHLNEKDNLYFFLSDLEGFYFFNLK